MSKHTPGPWRVEADCIDIGDEGWFKPFDGCGCCNSPWMCGETEERREADARLIAAAPDLLAALRSLSVAVEQFAPNANDWPELPDAKAAIAKATGETT